MVSQSETPFPEYKTMVFNLVPNVSTHEGHFSNRSPGLINGKKNRYSFNHVYMRALAVHSFSRHHLIARAPRSLRSHEIIYLRAMPLLFGLTISSTCARSPFSSFSRDHLLARAHRSLRSHEIIYLRALTVLFVLTRSSTCARSPFSSFSRDHLLARAHRSLRSHEINYLRTLTVIVDLVRSSLNST